MKKIVLLVSIVLMLCVYVEAADVPLTVIVPETHVSRTMLTLDAVGGYDIKISVLIPNTRINLGSKTFNFAARLDNETYINYGERFLREYFLNMIRIVELKNDLERLRLEVEELNPAIVNVPDNLLN